MYLLSFYIIFDVSKRYTGKSFKDSSIKKKLNWVLKKKGNLKKKSKKNKLNLKFNKIFSKH